MPFKELGPLEAEGLDTSTGGSGTGIWIHDKVVEFYQDGTLVGSFEYRLDDSPSNLLLSGTDTLFLAALNEMRLAVDSGVYPPILGTVWLDLYTNGIATVSGDQRLDLSSGDGPVRIAPNSMTNGDGFQLGEDSPGYRYVKGYSDVFDPPSVPANSNDTFIIPVPAGTFLDYTKVEAIYRYGLINGIMPFGCLVDTPNEIKLQVRNVTGGAVNIAPRTFNFTLMERV